MLGAALTPRAVIVAVAHRPTRRRIVLDSLLCCDEATAPPTANEACEGKLLLLGLPMTVFVQYLLHLIPLVFGDHRPVRPLVECPLMAKDAVVEGIIEQGVQG